MRRIRPCPHDLLDDKLFQVGPAYLADVTYTPAGIAESTARRIIQVPDDAHRRLEMVAEYVDENYGDFFFLKSDDFATEFEYRAVVIGPGDDYLYVDYGESIVAVVVGERFPDWQLAGARAACGAAGIALRRIEWRHGRPVARLLRTTPT